MLLFVIFMIVASSAPTCLGIWWEGKYWAMGCEFRGNALAHIRSSVQDCEGQCASTYGCTHFTWNRYNGGTCWMKKNSVFKNDAIASKDIMSVCGVIKKNSVASVSGIDNVLATRHGATESGACALPRVNYNVQNPVALGDINELQYLKFTPELCGHVLTVDCGHGSLDVIINNSNLGGGLDLYASSWDVLTNQQPPGETRCSVELSSQNAINGDGYTCYYKPGTDHENRWYHNVGLLNTNDKLVTEARIGDKTGAHRGANPYFAFDGEVDDNEQVQFRLSDGSEKWVTLRDCVYVNDENLWS